ncbi:hypothetical protein BKA93DRAFT_346227 [Sparassis latifolia]
MPSFYLTQQMSLSNNNPELLDIARGSFHGVEASLDMNDDASNRDWSWVSLPAQYGADQHMSTASASPSTSASVSHRTRLPGLFSRTACRNVMPSRIAPYPVPMLSLAKRLGEHQECLCYPYDAYASGAHHERLYYLYDAYASDTRGIIPTG